jgi:glycosyltransferase involved in cell wall biosynthesis
LKRKKIVYISSAVIPSRTANSIQVMKMCQAFAKNNYDVTLIVRGKKTLRESDMPDVFSFYGVEECFRIIKPARFPLKKGRKIIYAWRAACKARKLAADIVYSRNERGAFFSTRFKIPTIFESHQPPHGNDRLSQWMFKKLCRSRWLVKIVVITYALREHFCKNYPEFRGEIQVAPDGADPMPEHMQPIGLAETDNKLQVGYVGHLYKGKGIEVIAGLIERCPWASFHVVGGMEEDLARWKTELTGCPNIVFHGHVPPNKTAAYIKAFDVVLLPNQPFVADSTKKNIAPWTSPLKLFEYMTAGKPIIASDLPVLREVLRPEDNAILCQPDNVEEWAQALTRLRDDGSLRQRIGNAARKDFEANYTWLARAGKVLEYKEKNHTSGGHPLSDYGQPPLHSR